MIRNEICGRTAVFLGTGLYFKVCPKANIEIEWSGVCRMLNGSHVFEFFMAISP